MVNYGLQLYSVRDITEKNLEEAIKRVSEMGYSAVEFAGFFDNDAKTVKSWLDKYGVTVCGTHTGVALLTPENIDATIAYHKEIGCDTLIIPMVHWQNKEITDANIKLFNELYDKLAAEGITLGYHNHSLELFPNADGLIAEDEIIKRTKLMIEIDVFWLYNAGYDVISYLEEHKDRIGVIHLKDGLSKHGEGASYDNWINGAAGKSSGEGNVPIADIRAWAIKNGKRMVIESEGLNPTGLEEVERCIKYLRSLEV